MGREGGSSKPTAAHSSIALLQERFRQLQRIKEMREERALLKACSQPEHSSPATSGQHPKWFLHPDLVQPTRPQHGPRVEPGSSRGSTEYLACTSTSPPLGSGVGVWDARSSGRNGSNASADEMDVDTSLHL